MIFSKKPKRMCVQAGVGWLACENRLVVATGLYKPWRLDLPRACDLVEPQVTAKDL